MQDDNLQDNNLQDDSLQEDKCKMIIFKTIQFAKLQATSECAKNERGTGLKELPRPHKLSQSVSTKSVKGEVKISKTCFPPVGGLPKVLEKG